MRKNSKTVLADYYFSEDHYLRHLFARVIEKNVRRYSNNEYWSILVGQKVLMSLRRYEKRRDKVK